MGIFIRLTYRVIELGLMLNYVTLFDDNLHFKCSV